MDLPVDAFGDAVIAFAPSGTITLANAAAEAMFGYTNDEFIGLSFEALHAAAENIPECRAKLTEVLTEGSVARCTFTLKRKSGDRIPAEQTVSALRDADGNITGGLAVVRDMSAAVASEQQWRELAENIPDYVAVVARDGKILFVNRTAPGFEVEKVIGSSTFDFAQPEMHGRLRASLDKVFNDGEQVEWDTEGLGAYGAPVWYRARMRPVMRDGEVIAATILAIDMTEHKKSEDQLKESTRAFAEGYERERKAAKELRELDAQRNAFLTAVAHELRTPLTSVLGMAQTLRSDRLSTEERDECVQRLLAKAQRLDRLLSDLLDLDRLRKGLVTAVRTPTDLGLLIKRIVADVDGLNGRTVELDIDASSANIDGPKVERIVDNLLVNIVRYTPGESRVWVRAHQQDGGVLLCVEDDGPGVPEHLRTAVFEQFRQGEGVPLHAPGVGIGLSLVARFARLHDGRAWVEERYGGGASFRVFLGP